MSQQNFFTLTEAQIREITLALLRVVEGQWRFWAFVDHKEALRQSMVWHLRRTIEDALGVPVISRPAEAPSKSKLTKEGAKA
jgi:hypothetical protein